MGLDIIYPYPWPFTLSGRMLYLDADGKTALVKNPDGTFEPVGVVDGSGNVYPLPDPAPDVTVESHPT